MSRLPALTYEALDEAQRATHAAIAAGPRGEMPVVLAISLRNPRFTRLFQELGAYMRYDLDLPPALAEIAVLVTAQWYGAAYMRRIHLAKAALTSLDPAVVEAIVTGREPPFTRDDEHLVYDFCRHLLQTRGKIADEDLYNSALELLGETGMVTMIGAVGFYSMVATVLNGFDIAADDT